MITCAPDPGIERVTIGDFAFPLGVYPVEPLAPAPGYRVDFEPADGTDPDAAAAGEEGAGRNRTRGARRSRRGRRGPRGGGRR
jgi:hypothetical protein